MIKKKFFMLLPVVFILIASGFQGTASGDTCTLCHSVGNYFYSSLHHSARGMEYWYSSEGGLEEITGVPYEDYANPSSGCKNCHASTCSKCHTDVGPGVEPTGPPPGTPSEIQTMCLVCHARAAAIITKDDGFGTPDVHRAGGMRCMDCHSSRELHGDGIVYKSMKKPGAMDTECEKCHTTMSPSPSHTAHNGKLDCKACHQRRVVSCYNCHMDTAYYAGKRMAKTQIADWVFLMNYEGKVTSANMQTFVGGPEDKTFLMFAPVHSHSIMSPGRICEDCHNTTVVNKIYTNKALKLTWLEGTTLKWQTGVIPVVAGTTYKFISYDKDNDDLTGATWRLLTEVPLGPDQKQYKFANGTPLTSGQLEKMKLPYVTNP
jgi:hypothetical protein